MFQRWRKFFRVEWRTRRHPTTNCAMLSRFVKCVRAVYYFISLFIIYNMVLVWPTSWTPVLGSLFVCVSEWVCGHFAIFVMMNLPSSNPRKALSSQFILNGWLWNFDVCAKSDPRTGAEEFSCPSTRKEMWKKARTIARSTLWSMPARSFWRSTKSITSLYTCLYWLC